MEPEVDEVVIDESPIRDTADVAHFIGIILKLDHKVEALESQKKEAAAYYDRAIEKVKKNQAYLEGQIEGWLVMNGQKSLSTHSGTAILTTRNKTTWPEESVLLEWATKHPRHEDFVETKHSIKKRALIEYLDGGEEPPPGYGISRETSLSIRKISD